jgi:hypothetical protein
MTLPIRCSLRILSLVGLAAALPFEVTGQPAMPPRWRGAVELTVGGANAVDGADLARTSGLAVDATGRIFVADAQDQKIRVFSNTGALVASVGRSGSGPLEFKRLATIVIGPDRLLWARDEGNARMTALDVSKLPATSVRQVPLRQFTGGSRVPITFDATGALIDESIYFDNTMESFRPLRLRRAQSGDVLRTDTLPVPPGAFAGVHKVLKVQKDAAGRQVGMSQGYLWQPFGPEWLRAYGALGLRADAVGSRYEVNIYSADGKLLRTLRRAVAPVPVSAREKRVKDSTLAAQSTDLPFGVPTHKAPLIGLRWTEEGELWIERSVADGQPREADVYDANGRFIAIAEWPHHVDLIHEFSVIRGRIAHSVTTDANDLESVVRLRFR